jgi:hypothetical protein
MSPKTERNRKRSSSEIRYRSVLYLLESPPTLKQVEIGSIMHRLWEKSLKRNPKKKERKIQITNNTKNTKKITRTKIQNKQRDKRRKDSERNIRAHQSEDLLEKKYKYAL